jgi:hypothetical protein
LPEKVPIKVPVIGAPGQYGDISVIRMDSWNDPGLVEMVVFIWYKAPLSNDPTTRVGSH